MASKNIQRLIVGNLLRSGYAFDLELVLRFEAKVIAASPDNVDDFVFVIVRNWERDQHRRAVAAKRMAAKQKEKEQAVAEACARFESARNEYWFAAEQALQAHTNFQGHARVDEHLRLLYLVVFAGAKASELESLFGIFTSTRHKWLQRARKILAPFVSENLKAVIAGKGG